MPALRVLAALAVSASLASRAEAAAEAAPETFRCSARGGPEWREYRSRHFVVASDASRGRIELLVRKLEKMQALVVKALVGEGVEIPGRVRVVALTSPAVFPETFRVAGGGREQVTGYFAVSRFDEPTIVLALTGFEADPEMVAHELAHHVSWYLFPRQPRWFAEGLATFVQTIGTEEERAPQTGTHVQVGQRRPRSAAGLAPRYLAQALQHERAVAPAELLAWRGREESETPSRYHVWSWLLYHWLWNTRSKQFADYTSRLSAAEDPATAWRTAFPDLDPARPEAMAKLENALEMYRKTGRYTYYSVSAEADATFTDSPLAPADVHLLLLDVRPEWPQGEARAALVRAEVEEALREDPAQPQAIESRARLEKATAVPALRAAVTARPRDWRAWALLGAALHGEAEAAEKEAALRKAVALEPDSAWAQNDLAWALAVAKRPREALPFANRAVDLAPWDPSAIDTLAVVAADLGKCPEALVLERRAADLAAPGASGDGIRKRLQEYERRCGGAAAAPR